MSGFSGYSAAVGASGASVTLAAPAGTVAGSMLVATFMYQQSAAYGISTAMAGWTEVLHYDTGSVGASSGTYSVQYRICASSGEATSYTIPGVTGTVLNASIARYTAPASGVVGTSVGKWTSNQAYASKSAVSIPSVTTTAASYLIAGSIQGYYGSGAATASPAPSGMTTRINTGNQTLWDEYVASGGASGTISGGVIYGDHYDFALYVGGLSAPSAPTLNVPTSGATLDVSAGVAFTGTYHSTDTYAQNAYALRIKTSGGSYQYWKASTSSLSATIVWNPVTTADGATWTVTLPPSAVSNGNTYNWSLASQESGANDQGPFAADATFIAQAVPTAAISAPSGTITDTSEPATTWTATAGSGATLTAYTMIWETGSFGTTPGSGTQVATTGSVTIGGALTTISTSTSLPTALDNHGSFRVFLQVSQTGDQVTSWVYSDFSLDLTAPDPPTLVVTAGHATGTGAPTVTIVATGDDSGHPFLPSQTTFQIQYSEDGVTWVDVRGADAVTPISGDTVTVVDYEASLGPVMYRGRVTGTDTDDNVVTGSWSSVSTVTLTDTTSWLTDPLDPTVGLPAPCRADDTRTRGITQDITVTLGSPYPVISSDVRQAQTGSFTWGTSGVADRNALLALLDGRVLLQRIPTSGDDVPEPGVYFVPTGSISVARLATESPISDRSVTSAWASRSRP